MKRLSRAATLRVPCPKCGSPAGSLCRGVLRGGAERKTPHIERYAAAAPDAALPGSRKAKRSYGNSKRKGGLSTNLEWQILRARVFAQHGSQCVYCGADASHVDHKLPLARGGTDDLDNLVPSCVACNIKKGSLTFEEFRSE